MAESGRYYTKDGELVTHTKDGKKVGLAEARKRLLYPSVTTILKTLAEPLGLKLWRERNLVLAGATTPRHPDEDDGVFTKRVVQEAYEEGEMAAQFGTEMHAAIRDMLKGGIGVTDGGVKVPEGRARMVRLQPRSSRWQKRIYGR